MPKKGYKQSEEHKSKVIAAAKIRASAKKVLPEYTICHTCGKSFVMSDDQRQRSHRNPDKKCYCSLYCHGVVTGKANLGRKRTPEYKAKKRAEMMGNQYLLGHKHTAETLEKMSITRRGNKYSLGYKHSDKTRSKMSVSKKGHLMSTETRAKISVAKKGNNFMLGHKHSKLTKQKMSASALRGEKSPNWKGGITPLIERIRRSPEYMDWRTAVFTRDDFTCSLCGKRGYRLQAHHIKTFSKNPELRFDPNNGVTLCLECHGGIKGKEHEHEKHFLERKVANCS